MFNGLGKKKNRKQTQTQSSDTGRVESTAPSLNGDPDDSQDQQHPNPNPNPPEPSHISTSHYNRRCRELLQLDRDLRELGAQMFFSLPRISVIGSQSAGKSSLVEAVSGINVPRDSGTCTRCPMECTMSQDPTWSCTISLRLNGTGPDQYRTAQFGPTLTNKADVEIWLRRAQAAILSPHMDAGEFYGKSKAELQVMRETDSRMLQFSKNSIHVDIKDPEVTGLSFIDLPGLIQNSETPGLIDLVKDVVTSNIEGDSTMILIAIPMSDDIENQQAVRLAKEADPTGKRTVGVLTKPDVVLPSSVGQLQKWKDVLEGKAHELEHGYYCVRLPDETERNKNLPRSESERLADGFFRNRSPWNQMADRSRFGVPNLVKDISALLVRWIEENLPTLRKQVNELIDACNNELRALPPPLTTDPSTEILQRVGALGRAFQDAVNATENKVLVRRARERYQQFKHEILRTSPDFRPFIAFGNYRRPDVPDDIVDKPDAYRTPPMDLGYVRQVIKDSIGWELPGHVPYAATLKLVNESTSLWKEPSLVCFADIFEMTAETIGSLVSEHFNRFPKAESYIRSLVNSELETCKANAREVVEKLLQSESQPIFTQNLHYFETQQTKWLNHYWYVKRNPQLYLGTYEAATENHSSRSVVGMIRPPTPPHSQDPYAEELTLMSRVHAYFRVAYKRIIDRLPLAIEHSLNRALESSLSNTICEKLVSGQDYAQKMAELAEENPDISEKRQKLSERQRRLLQIKTRLDKLRDQ